MLIVDIERQSMSLLSDRGTSRKKKISKNKCSRGRRRSGKAEEAGTKSDKSLDQFSRVCLPAPLDIMGEEHGKRGGIY